MTLFLLVKRLKRSSVFLLCYVVLQIFCSFGIFMILFYFALYFDFLSMRTRTRDACLEIPTPVGIVNLCVYILDCKRPQKGQLLVCEKDLKKGKSLVCLKISKKEFV